MSTPKIMIIDDEEEILDLEQSYLKRENYQVICIRGGKSVVEEVNKEDPDLIVMDCLLSGIDGLEVCQQLRKITDVPILFVSAKCEDVDKVVGLSAGADDYIGKPFSPIELVARVKAHLRRNNIINQHWYGKKQVIKLGDLHIDLTCQRVQLGDNTIFLSAREFKLLTQLAQHPGRIYSMDELYELIWDTKNVVDVRTIMVHISNLRKKLEIKPSTPPYIITVRGAGYKFNENL